MSRVVTTPSTPHTHVQVPYEKIAKRAYERWCQRGRPHGTDKQDWYEAEAELRAEHARGGAAGAGYSSNPNPQRR